MNENTNNRLHLNKLQRVMGQVSAVVHVTPISDAILPTKETK